MAKFRSLGEIQKYLEQNTAEVLAGSMELERVLADEMSQAVVDVVYAYYEPEEYERRMDEEGLSDTRNMEVTDWGIRDGQPFLIFENLTQGADSQSSVFITDMIEDGDKSMWNNPNGPWSDKREFVAETARRLKENPEGMLDALRKGLQQKGMKLK